MNEIPHGNAERESHGHVDDRIADDRGRRRASNDEVVAVYQVRRPGRIVGRRNDRIQIVLAEQQIGALCGTNQPVPGNRLVYENANAWTIFGELPSGLVEIDDLIVLSGAQSAASFQQPHEEPARCRGPKLEVTP